MKLLLKFNLVFILVFALGLAATGYVSWALLERNARDEIAQSARLLMETAIATRTYTTAQVNPLLETQMKYTFLPQSVAAYAATEVFNDVRKKHAEYSYKEAALNPTNPQHRAVDWEADVISQFRNNKDSVELIGERDTPTGRSFYVARPFRITNPACLRCHSTVEAAPKSPSSASCSPSHRMLWAYRSPCVMPWACSWRTADAMPPAMACTLPALKRCPGA